MKRKVNKLTRKFVEPGKEGEGPSTESWMGRIYVIDSEKSVVAKKVGFKEEGEYAIKVR